MRRVATIAFTLTVLFALGGEAAQAAFPGTNGRVAFGVNEWRLPVPCSPVAHGCEPELVSSTIQTVLPNGRGRRVLRAFPVERAVDSEAGPVWAPSGNALTFQQGNRLAIIRRDGTGYRRLPQLTGGEGYPTWSPDGRRLAFSGRSFCCNWLFTVRPDGTGLRRVIAQDARWPAWSVTRKLAFVNYNDRAGASVGIKDGLYTIRPDGSHVQRLFGRYWGTGQQPDWSPDGSWIAFHARNHIFKIRENGRGLRRLTTPKSSRNHNSDAAWSPNGNEFAFIRNEDLFVMQADGSRVRRVVDARQPDLERSGRSWEELSPPSWQPLR